MTKSGLTKLKVFADKEFSEAQIIAFVFERTENTVRKRENAGHQHFLFSPKCFQKTSCLGFIKTAHKVKDLTYSRHNV